MPKTLIIRSKDFGHESVYDVGPIAKVKGSQKSTVTLTNRYNGAKWVVNYPITPEGLKLHKSLIVE